MRTRRLLFVGLMLLLIVGCFRGPSLYLNPSYSPGHVKKIAALPIMGLSTERADQFDTAIMNMLKCKYPSIIIINAPEATKAINKYGLADDWNDFLGKCAKDGTTDADVLRKIGKAVNTSAVIQGEIVAAAICDGRLFLPAQACMTVRYSIFDCNNGELLWQVTCRAEQMRPAWYDAPFEPALEQIIAQISKNLPPL